MREDPGHGWCPKCASFLVLDPGRTEPRCSQHGSVVDTIYRCRVCGKPEEFRAIDNIPQHAHYCGSCTEYLAPDVRAHLERVAGRSTAVTGPWRPA